MKVHLTAFFFTKTFIKKESINKQKCNIITDVESGLFVELQEINQKIVEKKF